MSMSESGNVRRIGHRRDTEVVDERFVELAEEVDFSLLQSANELARRQGIGGGFAANALAGRLKIVHLRQARHRWSWCGRELCAQRDRAVLGDNLRSSRQRLRQVIPGLLLTSARQGSHDQ